MVADFTLKIFVFFRKNYHQWIGEEKERCKMGRLIEEWRDIKGYEGIYQVSNLGNIRSLDRMIKHFPKDYFQKGKILKPGQSTNGYLMVILMNHNKRKTRNVHRLVAEALLENSEGLEEINHKDEDKTNNRVDNLEWCDHKYNANYGNRNKKISIKARNRIGRQSVMYEHNGETRTYRIYLSK